MTEFNDRKVIRNRSIVREVDHDSTLELRWSICVGFIFAGLVCVYNWQQHRMVEFGYRLEAIKKEAGQLEETRKKLYLEQAMLESPARIFQLAQDKLGLAAPKARQVIFDPAPAVETIHGPGDLTLDMGRRTEILNPISEAAANPTP